MNYLFFIVSLVLYWLNEKYSEWAIFLSDYSIVTIVDRIIDN